ncbi:carbohydrate ABC transporter permease [Mahella australiensis]|uniref:Carbohydrate ABC transporter membrane protein 2, CUT1 family n=1 Tax=Mahella australiensis (strain DSM 15567 / CIP 107919 / 50-1 BON) TaxID=697281 RepID=F4A2E6_MAHA5|nr:carbohydrate ABC transporter permease [Mahella australiensis]AEE97212.1 carbohydrate ABC transporter membrane protein 2, CUT1 family [Mahella australiensis 50-1 BON]
MKDKYYASRHAQQVRSRIIVSAILLAGSIILLMPLWWMVSTSLKSMDEIMQYPPTFYPHEVHWENYIEAWHTAPFTRYTLNTLLICAFSVTGSVLSNSFVGYGFAKIHFRGRETFMSVVLATMIIPGFVTLIPQYVLFSKLGWVNTYLPLIVPPFFGSAFFIFMFRQFYMTIPNELVEAAKIDGANHFYIWFWLMLPMVKPVLATVAIFSFNGAWNDLIGPLLYLNDEMKYTLQIGLQNFRGLVQTQWHYLMAASTLVLLPVLTIFFVFQRYFIEGMNLTAGMKG